ncbi:MAG TPA: hypothetical protein VG944_22550 [Fimbriimonas sp.]|nr:hypothetical protein [Fimbriimonas sp.]
MADRYRFFWECWQNADDAGAKALRFVIGEDQLVVENDGRAFSYPDVYSLCFVASSQKEQRVDQMGHFGIGFLTAMLLTDRPAISSGNFHFALEKDFTYPTTVPGQPFVDGTKLILPYTKNVNPSDLAAELLRRLDDEVLLYMGSLTHVEVTTPDGQTAAIDVGVPRSRGSSDEILLRGGRWSRYRRTVQAEPELEREDGEPVRSELPIVLARSETMSGPNRVSAFFPTSVEHQLPWRFSAPFEVTNSREAIPDTPYNRWLFARVGELLVDAAIDDIAGKPKDPWDLLPTLTNKEGLLAPLYEAAYARLREITWVPTNQGPKKPDLVAVPASANLKNLMAVGDVSDPSIRQRVWVKGHPPKESVRLLMHVGAAIVCCHDLLEILAQGPNKPPDWYLKATAEVIRLAEYGPHSREGSIDEKLLIGKCFLSNRKRPFSLARANELGKVISITRSSVLGEKLGKIADSLLGVLNSIYRIPEKSKEIQLDEDRVVVGEWLRRQHEARALRFEPRLDAPQFIRHFIVDINDARLATLDGTTHDALLSFVRDHLESFQETYRRTDLVATLGRKLRVEAQITSRTGDRETARTPLASTYLSSGFGDFEWSRFARGVPKIAWIARKYRTLLKRAEPALPCISFLKRLGVRECPEPRPLDLDYSHGTHHFLYVTRNDRRAFPNYPHDSLKHTYSVYGLRGDSDCPDLRAALEFVAALPEKEHESRFQSLWNLLQKHWADFQGATVAQACGYHANAEYNEGRVPSRWLDHLRRLAWVKVGATHLRAPVGLFAPTEQVINVLGQVANDVSQWPVKNEGAVQALGMLLEVPGEAVIDRLRQARANSTRISIDTARRYYRALATGTVWTDSVVAEFNRLELIYSPTRNRTWWAPADCFRSNQFEVFGDRRTYLETYADANNLWINLGIEFEPTVNSLVRFWDELARAEISDLDIHLLASTYDLANRIVDDSASVVVPLWTNQGWQPSTSVLVGDDDLLLKELEELGIARSLLISSRGMPKLCRWAGISRLEEVCELSSPNELGVPDDNETQRFLEGVQLFALELGDSQPELWQRIGSSIERWQTTTVRVANSLQLDATVRLVSGSSYTAKVTRPAHFAASNLTLSGITELTDAAVSRAVVASLGLAGNEEQFVASILRNALFDASRGTVPYRAPKFPALHVEQSKSHQELFDNANEATPPDEEDPEPIAAVPDDFGDAPLVEELVTVSDTIIPEGRPGEVQSPELALTLRAPFPGKGHRVPANRQTRPVLSIEQRGLDIYVKHVLQPAGIRVSDQRLRRGVGADLYCSDSVFRELKTFSGAAPNTIRLTKHEHARASDSTTMFELVIVENVYTSPRIIVVRDPLTACDTRPRGDVDVSRWDAAIGRRIIDLHAPEPDAEEDQLTVSSVPGEDLTPSQSRRASGVSA